jgi:hypothetical protein
MLDTRRLSDVAWEGYFRPIEDRISRLRPGADPRLLATLDHETAEIERWRAHREETGYLLLVVRPHEPAGLRGPGRARRSRPVPRRHGHAARGPRRAVPALCLQPRGQPRALGHGGADDRRDAPAILARRGRGDRAGRAPRAHEVAAPLAAAVRAEDAGAARRACGRAAVGHLQGCIRGCGHFERYLDATGGNLDWVAARPRCAGRGGEAVRDAAWAAALARFLVAVPELEARGRIPLVDGRAEAVSAPWRQEGLADRLARARARGQCSGRGRRALFAGWQAEALLRQAAADPAAVAEGRLAHGRGRGKLAAGADGARRVAGRGRKSRLFPACRQIRSLRSGPRPSA